MNVFTGVKKQTKIAFFVFITFNLAFIICLSEGLTGKAYALSSSYESGDALEAKIIAEELAKEKKAEKKYLVNDLFKEAKANYDSKNYETAQQLFERLLQLDPKNNSAKRYIELCREAMKKELPGTVTGSMIKRGKENYQMKEYAASVADFESALAANPNDAEAQMWLAKAKATEDLYAKKKATKEERKNITMARGVAKEEKDTAEQSMLLDVDKGWLPPEKTIKEEIQVEEIVSSRELADKEARRKIEEKMASIMVPALSVTDADVQDLIRQLMEMTGVTIVIDERAFAELTREAPIKISLSTADAMPLLDILNIAFKTTQLGYKVEPNYVWVSKKSNTEREDMVTKTYKLKYGQRQTRKVELKEFETKK